MPLQNNQNTTSYQLGSCYICSKCLFCFETDKENCNCNKDIRPLKVKNTPSGQHFFSRVFSPDTPPFSQAYILLKKSNDTFQYETNFDLSFPYTLCGACNSKYQRTKYKDNQNLKEKLSQQDEDSDDTSSELENLRLYIIIESKQKNNAAKALSIFPIDFNNVIEEIHSYIKKSVGDKNINMFDYTLQYKALNSRGTANTLEDEADFVDFLDEYQKIITNNKKMGISVILNSIYINNIQKRKKNNKKVCNYNNIIIVNCIKYFNIYFIII